MSAAGAGTFLEGGRVVDATGARVASLRLAGGRVVAVDGRHERGDVVVPLDGHLLFPGLLNAHEHLGLNAFPQADAGGPRPSAYDWIEALQPALASPPFREVKRVGEEVRVRHGALKNLLAGATTVAHHDPWLAAMGESDFPVRVVRPYGWCHSLRLAGRYGPTVVEALAATPPGARFFIHLAEGTDGEAAGELARLDALGGLGPATVIVHGVGLTRHDVERVVARGAGVAWCPASNLRVLGATLDPRPLLHAGRIALGTDSRLSGAFDLLAELRVAREVAGLAGADLLRLVTTDAAALVGDPHAGRLREGARADLVVAPDPGGDPRSALAGLTRASLRAVVRAGAPRVADPDLLPWLEAAGVPVLRVVLDGAPKVVDARLFTDEASVLEPGLSHAGEPPHLAS